MLKQALVFLILEDTRNVLETPITITDPDVRKVISELIDVLGIFGPEYAYIAKSLTDYLEAHYDLSLLSEGLEVYNENKEKPAVVLDTVFPKEIWNHIQHNKQPVTAYRCDSSI